MKKDCHAGRFAPRSTSAVLATADEAESKAVTCARAKPCVHLASGSPEGNTNANSPIARRRSRLSRPPARARASARSPLWEGASRKYRELKHCTLHSCQKKLATVVVVPILPGERKG